MSELRRATRASAQQFKQTGIRLEEQIREAELVEKRITKPKEIKIPINIKNILIKKDEIFNPKLGGFVRKSDPSGQATGFIRPPTPKERLAIDEAKRRGSLENLNKIIETFTTPEGVRSLFRLGAEITLQGGEALASGVEDILVSADEFLGIEGIGISRDSKLFTTPSPISRETAREIITDIFIFSTFQPFIETATASKTSQAAKVVQKSATEKKKIEALRALREKIKK